jgi:iron(III) transport system ATP-binding protein
MSFLRIQNLYKTFDRVVAVDRINLEIKEGEFFTLLGSSGCGKTTTLRMVGGLEKPDGGAIYLGDQCLVSSDKNLFIKPEKRNMGMVFQSYALWPHMTVMENVAYGLTLRKLDKALIARKVQTILSVTKLEALAARYPGELSGGQQQRVALARALIVEPETLLLDEPLSNLDANLREEMRFEVRRLHDEYRYTTVYVTHDQSEAMTTADLIAVMNAGKIEQAGTPEEIYNRPRSEFVARFIGSSNVVKGKAVDAAHMTVAGATIRCTGEAMIAGKDAAISIRQHEIRLVASEPAPAGANVVPATVIRHVFLGNSRDYMVELADGTQLRVVTSADQSVPQGEKVWLELPPQRCRVLVG